MVIIAAFLTKLSLLSNAALVYFLEWTSKAKWLRIFRKLPLVRGTSSCSTLPLLSAMDHLHGTTQGLHRYSNFFFGNFIVRQPAFWVCCYHCSQLMFLTLFLARLVPPDLLRKKEWKAWHCFMHFSLSCVLFHKNGCGEIILFNSMALQNKEEECHTFTKNLSLPDFLRRVLGFVKF